MIGIALAVTIGIHLADVFPPPKMPALSVWSGETVGVRMVELSGSDGVKLRGWWLQAASPNAPFVIFFYGSNEDVLIERSRLDWLAKIGVNAVCIDYRGYGFSDGRPQAALIKDDALRVFDHVKAHIASAGVPIFVYGWSVGSQMAIHVAATRPVAGVILQAPPASAQAMNAASRQTDVPAVVRWAVRLKSDADVRSVYQGAKEARAITAPLLVIEGSKDVTVPPAQARAVVDAAASRSKRLVMVDGADHNTLRFEVPPASTAVQAFFDRP